MLYGTMNQPPAQRKKVLYVITKSNWGGAQRYVYDLATHLDRTRYEPVVAMGGHGLLTDLLNHAGIRTITITSLQRDIDGRQEWEFIKELWRILGTERPAILHINSSKAGAVGALLGRIRRTPRVIFTAHGWAFNEDRPWWQRLVIKAIHWQTVLLSHRTIAVSRAIMRELNWPWAASRFKLVHPGRTIGPMYDRTEAREKLAQFFPALAPTAHDFWIGCVAELHPIKQHQLLIEAMKTVTNTHPTARLICIGAGELMATLAAQISAAGLPSSVFLVGSVPEAARFMKAFDLLALVSRSESYGYVLHEAGLAKVPVLASDRGGIRDIVEHEKSGYLVQNLTPAHIAEAISRLISRPQLRADYAETLHARMESRTVSRMVAETAALYELH